MGSFSKRCKPTDTGKNTVSLATLSVHSSNQPVKNVQSLNVNMFTHGSVQIPLKAHFRPENSKNDLEKQMKIKMRLPVPSGMHMSNSCVMTLILVAPPTHTYRGLHHLLTRGRNVVVLIVQ